MQITKRTICVETPRNRKVSPPRVIVAAQPDPSPAPSYSRTRQAMNAGAGIVERDEAASAAICRDMTDGEVIHSGYRPRYARWTRPDGKDHVMALGADEPERKGRRRDVIRERRERRASIWAVHELRDMGHLARDLVETAERFSALNLRLDPSPPIAKIGDEGRGGEARPHEVLLRRTALAEHVDALYSVVAKSVGGADIALFAMAFDPLRPSVSEMKAALGRDFADVCRVIDAGLIALSACEPITPTNEALNARFRGVNELVGI